MTMNHRTTKVAILAGLSSIVVAIVSVQFAAEHNEQSVDARDPASQLAAVRDTPSGREIATGVIDQTTLRRRAVFPSVRGGTFEVHHGLLLPKFNSRGADRQSSGKSRWTCAILTGHGYSTASCDNSPFSDSTLLFTESWSGGAEPTARTEFQVSGLASPRVARINAIDANGRTRSVHLENGAFFVELSQAELAAGVTLSTLRVYDASGTLVEVIDL
jgi:hypothetical protein